jgi:hypothetical protein
MKKDAFTAYTRSHFLFRAVDTLSPVYIIVVSSVLTAIGLLVAWHDKSYRNILSAPTVSLTVGSILGFVAMRWTRQQLPRALEEVQPAFVSDVQVDTAIRSAVDRFPHWIFSILLAAAGAEWLCEVIPRVAPKLTTFYMDGLCIVAGLVFGFGLPAWLWTYFLILNIRCETVDLFAAHRLRWLSAYACSLGCIGIVPAMFVIGLYIQYGPSPWLLAAATLQTVVAVVLIIGTEMAIWQSLLSARSAALDTISVVEKQFFDKLKTCSNGDRKDILDQLDKVQKIRQGIASIRGIHFVPWGDVCWKIFIPTMVGVSIFTYQLVVHATSKP